MNEEMNRELLKVFLDESQELLAELEHSLLELEDDPGDRDLVGRVFRALHTIKGNGAMFGFERVSHFTHELESLYALVREGTLSLTKDMVDLTLRARDRIKEMIASPPGEEPWGEEEETILRAFRALVSSVGPSPAAPREVSAPVADRGVERTYRLRWKPKADIFTSGTNPLALLRELAALGDCQLTPFLEDIPPLGEMDPESCYLGWDILLTTHQSPEQVRELFLFVEDRGTLALQVIDSAAPTPAVPPLGAIMVERGDLPVDQLKEILRQGGGKPLGEELVERGLVRPAQVESALKEQALVRGLRQKRQQESLSSVRVESAKLDLLVNLVGELVTVQARLNQNALRIGDGDLIAIAEEVERLTWELRDNAFSVRMVPIGTTFSTFRRLVRDLSHEMGKEVDLVTEGADTELDKNVIEKLHDPLVHLIRNAVDHGMESPAERERKGKMRRGTINLSAVHAGAHVHILVRDDGRGLDPDAIRAKALERGLVSPEETLTAKECLALVFAAGFSTASAVTAVSGRGVGLDVVKRFVEALRGGVDIDSRAGEGTCVTIRLPLTLAIIEGLQVVVGEERFILPLSVVEECVELTRAEREESRQRRLAKVRGALIPYVRFRELFGLAGALPEREQVVIVGLEGKRVGFAVDHVVGEQQTVVKTLGKVYGRMSEISGATILGDGSVALILDVPELVRMAEAEGDAEGRG